MQVGQDAVRGYLAALPLPLEVVSTLAWGGRRHEGRILAGGTPLLLTFQGGDGLITYLYIERDNEPSTLPRLPGCWTALGCN